MKTGKRCLRCDIETVKVGRSIRQNDPIKGTEHHVYPLRHYPNSTKTIHLCWRCHALLENKIRKEEKGKKKLLPFQYELIADNFCNGDVI